MQRVCAAKAWARTSYSSPEAQEEMSEVQALGGTGRYSRTKYRLKVLGEMHSYIQHHQAASMSKYPTSGH